METIYIFIVVVVAILVVWWLLRRGSEAKVRYYETDLRLTYKRFMELYPNSEISYREYKELQARKAYRRSVGPKKIKRMVR